MKMKYSYTFDLPLEVSEVLRTIFDYVTVEWIQERIYAQCSIDDSEAEWLNLFFRYIGMEASYQLEIYEDDI